MKEQKICNFSIQKGDAEYLHSFLENIPDSHKDRARYARVLRAVETELQRWQLDWIAKQKG